MYAAIRQYQTEPGSIDEVVRRVNEDFVPLISDMQGFVAYFALNAGQGEFGKRLRGSRQRGGEQQGGRGVGAAGPELAPSEATVRGRRGRRI